MPITSTFNGKMERTSVLHVIQKNTRLSDVEYDVDGRK